MMFWNGDHTTWWGWLLMSIGMVVFWGLLIAGFVFLVRAVGNGSSAPTSSPAPRFNPTPEQILAERLARGEIDTAEYTERLHALHNAVNGKVRA